MSTNTNPEKLQQIIEGALLAAGRPLSIDQILTLFLDEDQPSREEIRTALEALQAACAERGVELKEVSSGFRYQVKAELAPWIARLWEEKPSKYSRATLETLALIAYRQPITRSEIEEVRGVTVSSNIIKSLLEREWIRVLGHRDVPGKPALYGTSKGFLDYFNLKSLSDLPPLAELRNIDSIEREFDFGERQGAANDADEAVEQGAAGDTETRTDETDATEVQAVELAEAEAESRQTEAESAPQTDAESAPQTDASPQASGAESVDATSDAEDDENTSASAVVAADGDDSDARSDTLGSDADAAEEASEDTETSKKTEAAY